MQGCTSSHAKATVRSHYKYVLAAAVGAPGRTAYSATKFALSGVSECLAAEVRSFGIHVTAVEPGALPTSFYDNAKPKFRANDSDYAELAAKLNEQFKKIDDHPNEDPGCLANAIITLSEASNPPLRVPLGADAVQMLSKRVLLMNEELRQWSDWAAPDSRTSNSKIR